MAINVTIDGKTYENVETIGVGGKFLYLTQADSGDGGEEKALSGISATYSGGDVAVGTDVSDLIGITVKATYSDGSTENVTGYLLSGTIEEGSNIIKVSYGGKTATFTVNGAAEIGGGDEPPKVTAYTVTAELINVTTDNSAVTVNEGEAYHAVLSAESGYTLGSVTVMMGGADVTAEVYADGVINIASVTGNIEIIAAGTAEAVEAVLPTDGLLSYFDLRNAKQEKVGTAYGIASPTAGEKGSLFDWSSGNGFKVSDEHGIDPERTNLNYSAEGGTTQSSLGTNFTVAVKSYSIVQKGFARLINYLFNANNVAGYLCNDTRKYTNESGSSVTVGAGSVASSDTGTGLYHDIIIRVNGAELTCAVDGETAFTDNGSNYEGFVKWDDQAIIGPLYASYAQITGIAVYNRAVSDIEMTEIDAFFKTLEVAA